MLWLYSQGWFEYKPTDVTHNLFIFLLPRNVVKGAGLIWTLVGTQKGKLRLFGFRFDHKFMSSRACIHRYSGQNTLMSLRQFSQFWLCKSTVTNPFSGDYSPAMFISRLRLTCCPSSLTHQPVGDFCRSSLATAGVRLWLELDFLGRKILRSVAWFTTDLIQQYYGFLYSWNIYISKTEETTLFRKQALISKC